ncbi:MAG: hypothetical protein BWY82_02783 [Verrucomicrobia bacterium ADurb.Bin474]|nr:MAG: hypothetical protein BWY82_02783 [Verrucomicrobia bacterium ADurb.Bin474]
MQLRPATAPAIPVLLRYGGNGSRNAASSHLTYRDNPMPEQSGPLRCPAPPGCSKTKAMHPSPESSHYTERTRLHAQPRDHLLHCAAKVPEPLSGGAGPPGVGSYPTPDKLGQRPGTRLQNQLPPPYQRIDQPRRIIHSMLVRPPVQEAHRPPP